MSGARPPRGTEQSMLTRAPWWRALVICLAMCAAAFSAPVLMPAVPGGEVAAPSLEGIVPANFAGWAEDRTVVPLQISPEVRAELDRLYSQTLSRTYVNGSGERVMLSVAFGAAQSKATQVHRPEVCYPAQGFIISERHKDRVRTVMGDIPVMRLVSRRGARTEPITYWIRVGDEVVSSGLGQKIAGIRQGLAGKVPDGLLFRVSSIGVPVESEYRVHDRFIEDLLDAVSDEQRQHLVGARS